MAFNALDRRYVLIGNKNADPITPLLSVGINAITSMSLSCPFTMSTWYYEVVCSLMLDRQLKAVLFQEWDTTSPGFAVNGTKEFGTTPMSE